MEDLTDEIFCAIVVAEFIAASPVNNPQSAKAQLWAKDRQKGIVVVHGSGIASVTGSATHKIRTAVENTIVLP